MPLTITIELSDEQLDQLAERIAAKVASPTGSSPPEKGSVAEDDEGPDSILLTAEEIAAQLGCTRRSILKWREDGIIPAAIHRGKFIRFDLVQVREALRQDATRQVAP